jgi:hypothetical protein
MSNPLAFVSTFQPRLQRCLVDDKIHVGLTNLPATNRSGVPVQLIRRTLNAFARRFGMEKRGGYAVRRSKNSTAGPRPRARRSEAGPNHRMAVNRAGKESATPVGADSQPRSGVRRRHPLREFFADQCAKLCESVFGDTCVFLK